MFTNMNLDELERLLVTLSSASLRISTVYGSSDTTHGLLKELWEVYREANREWDSRYRVERSYV
jgi:hypothetical protein